MNLQTHIASALSVTPADKLKLDSNIKEVLADVQILSRILKYTVVELEHLSIDEIISCIDTNQIELGTTSIEPGLTNLGKIDNLSLENHILGEGTIFFDIRFPVYYQNHSIKILINLEAQTVTSTKELTYHLENRIIYYLSRMISSQKNIEFFHSDYDNIKKVYSIWICMNPDEEHDSIHQFQFTQQTIFGTPISFPQLDKMQAVIIHIRGNEPLEKSKHKLICMLEDLLSKTTFSIKKNLLADRYGIKMSTELERRITNMGGFSDYYLETSIRKGLKQGFEQGMEQGMAQGMAQATETGIQTLVETLQELNTGKDYILKKIMEKYSLSESEAIKYL